jgi:hypothetical protein
MNVKAPENTTVKKFMWLPATGFQKINLMIELE